MKYTKHIKMQNILKSLTVLFLATLLSKGEIITVSSPEHIYNQQPLTGHLEWKTQKLSKYQSLGKFKITYYNGNGSAMEGGANNCFGEPLKEGMIAVDPDVIDRKSVV